MHQRRPLIVSLSAICVEYRNVNVNENLSQVLTNI